MKRLAKLLFIICTLGVLSACSFNLSQDEHETGFANKEECFVNHDLTSYEFLKY